MSQDDDCQRLIEATLPFAEQMLREYGEFFPFGAELRPDGELVSIGGFDGREQPPSKEIIAILDEHFLDAARRGEVIAVALVYDARVTPPGRTDATDAVVIRLDHQGGFSADLCFPYCVEKGIVTLDEPYVREGNGRIFPIVPSTEE